jgi:TonB family protein
MLGLSLILLSIGTAATPVDCNHPAPPAPTLQQAMAIKNTAELLALARLGDGSAAPSTLVLPPVTNGAEVFKYMREHFPQVSAADSAKQAMAMLWVCIDTAGVPSSMTMIGGTGNAALDTLATQLMTMARFEPPVIAGVKTAVWVPYPVQLSAVGMVYRAPPSDLAAKPTFTPYTVKPVILNRDQVGRALVTNYPPEMRNAGIGGEVQIWLFVNENGEVQKSSVRISSGHPELDAAAVEVARVMRFTPARNKDVPVPVWISLPIVFSVR